MKLKKPTPPLPESEPVKMVEHQEQLIHPTESPKIDEHSSPTPTTSASPTRATFDTSEIYPTATQELSHDPDRHPRTSLPSSLDGKTMADQFVSTRVKSVLVFGVLGLVSTVIFMILAVSSSDGSSGSVNILYFLYFIQASIYLYILLSKNPYGVSLLLKILFVLALLDTFALISTANVIGILINVPVLLLNYVCIIQIKALGKRW